MDTIKIAVGGPSGRMTFVNGAYNQSPSSTSFDETKNPAAQRRPDLSKSIQQTNQSAQA